MNNEDKKRWETAYEIIDNWYGITWGKETLEDIAQYLSIYAETDFKDILNLLITQIGDSVEDGELDGLAMEIYEKWEELGL